MSELQQETSITLTQRQLTFGEKAVGITFNPMGDIKVTMIKAFYANIIEHLHVLRNNSESSEIKRLCSVAITEAQGAQMWAVKALTWKD